MTFDDTAARAEAKRQWPRDASAGIRLAFALGAFWQAEQEPRCTCANDGNASRCTFHSQADYDAAEQEPTLPTEDEIAHVLSEWLNDDAPLGEAAYLHPARAVLALLNGGRS